MTILDRTLHLRFLLHAATIDWHGDTSTGTGAVMRRRLRGAA